jgi:hypothetical protein
MESIVTTGFLVYALIAWAIAFVLSCLSFGLVAALKEAWTLGVLLLMKIVFAIVSLVFGVSLLLNIIVFVVHVVKANA